MLVTFALQPEKINTKKYSNHVHSLPTNKEHACHQRQYANKKPNFFINQAESNKFAALPPTRRASAWLGDTTKRCSTDQDGCTSSATT